MHTLLRTPAVPLILRIALFTLLLLGLWSGSFDLPARAAPDTNVSGAIAANTTWTLGGSPYIVTGDVTVNAGVTLAIEAGVQVRFNSDLALIVLGTVFAQGTAAQPVIFTSNQPTPAAGDWGMLDFRSQSASNHLVHVIIEYGGDAVKAGGGTAAQVLANTSSLTIEQSIIRHSATRGVTLFQSSANIVDNTFDHNVREAIGLQTCDLAVGECHATITGNSFTNNLAPILHVGPHNPVLGGNSASANQTNGYVFWISCNVQGNNLFYANDLPYVIPFSGGSCIMGVYNRETIIEIQPGTVFKLLNSIDFWYTTVVTATATQEQPVIFTSLYDDSAGGDTNNDGAATTPAPKNWGMLHFNGANVRGFIDHARLRYGGFNGSWGPMVSSEGGAQVTVRSSELSYGSVGAYAYSPSSLELSDSWIHHMLNFGVHLATNGSVVLENNRFTDNTYEGVKIDRGTAVLRDNFFQNNPRGVSVSCSQSVQPCQPVISPNNRFIGSGQTGIYMSYPAQVCVDARRNWWGSTSGPADSSSTADYCSQGNNPGGTGTPVTDGVRYHPWTGGTIRPIIATPRCGLTGQNQPEFTGSANQGALIRFYDGETLLGQTTAGADDTFHFAPPGPLADGEHSITAIAELSGETSLPSTPPLTLIVDSSLPFDPQGVRLTYDLHGVIYSQYLRDDNGCAALNGTLDAPMGVRPGSTMTLVVPVKQEFTTGGAALQPATTQAARLPAVAESPASPTDGFVTVVNNGRKPVIGYKSAPVDGHASNRVYGEYGPFNSIQPPIPPGESRQVYVTGGVQDMAMINSDQYIAHRFDVEPGNTARDDLTIPNRGIGVVELENTSGAEITRMYIANIDGQVRDHFGGDMANSSNPFLNGSTRSLHLPDGTYDVVAVDSNQGLHIQRIVVDSYASQPAKAVMRRSNCRLKISNFSEPVHEMRFYRFPDGPKQPHTVPSPQPVNLMQMIFRNDANIEFPSNVTMDFYSEAGDFSLAPRKADGYLVGNRFYDYHVSAQACNEPKIELWSACKNSSFLDLLPEGSREMVEMLCDAAPNSTSASFLGCRGNFAAHAGRVGFRVCGGDREYNSTVAPTLIDPDGYVYDAFAGISAKIAGASVTCDVYDEDYQSWFRWPAELYEAQINPQVTAADGYYAFFVPPGLYRLNAIAAGYQPHTSPVIQVIDEIVHYNIPLVSAINLYLPLVIR